MPPPASPPPAAAPADAPETPAVRAARTWYKGFLARELAARGQPDAALYLEHFLRVTPRSEQQPAPGRALCSFGLAQRLTEYSLQLNGRDGKPVSWYIDFLARDGDTSAEPAELLAIATTAAAPPPDAVLYVSEYDTSSGRPFFRARWRHVHQGLPVEDDFIEVLVNAKQKKAFSCSKVWRTPQPDGPAAER
jgi:hypothetical protein